MPLNQNKTSKAGNKNKNTAKQVVEKALENAQRTTVEYSSLVRTPLNARRTKKHTIEQLNKTAESIMAVGILQNLVVYPMSDGVFGVAAGEGRLGAIEILLKSNRIPSEYQIPVLIVPEKIARLVSLIENSHRENMHPYDQIMAFSELRGESKTPQEIGAFTGFSTKHVQKMLKLSVMNPLLLEELAADNIDIDQLQALASSEDTDRQLLVWKNSQNYYNGSTPKNLRQSVLREEVSAENNPKLDLIGLDAYKRAGGTIRHDLFSECGFLSDPLLLDTLVLEALNKAAHDVAQNEGWKWGAGRFNQISRWGLDSQKYRLLVQHGSGLTELEEVAVGSMKEDISNLGRLLEEITDADEIWTAEQQLAEQNAKLNGFYDSVAKRCKWTEEQKRQAGVIAYIDKGKISYQFGVQLLEEVTGESNQKTDRIEEEKQTKREKNGYSAKLITSLSSERTLAVQAALSLRPDVIIASLLHDSIKTVFGGVSCYKRTLGVQISGNRSNLISNTYDAEKSKAVIALKEMHEKWLAELPENWEENFNWLIEWRLEKQLALLAYCMAGSINAVQQSYQPDRKIGAGLVDVENMLDFKMSEWWQPEKSNYFARISKDQIAEDLIDAGIPEKADSIQKMKKSDAAELASVEIAKTDWMPKCFLRQTDVTNSGEMTDTKDRIHEENSQDNNPSEVAA